MMTTKQTIEPIRPRKMAAQFDRTVGGADRIHIACPVRQWGQGCTTMPFLIVWTVGCVAVAYWAITKPEIKFVFFGSLCWAIWFFLFFKTLDMFLRKDELELDRTQVRLTRRMIVKIKQRTIPLSKVLRFGTYSKVIRTKNSSYTEIGLEVRALGGSQRCFRDLPKDELNWLLFHLNDFLGSVKGKAVNQDHPSLPPHDRKEAITLSHALLDALPDESSHTAEGIRGATVREHLTQPAVKTLADGRVGGGSDTAPTDSRWQRDDDLLGISFVQRGKLQAGGTIALSVFSLLWNGVLVALLCGLIPGPSMPVGGTMWWIQFLFLTPFLLVGLFMFVFALALFFEPIRRTRWTFADMEIRRSITWGNGIVGRTRRWEVTRLGRIDMRRSELIFADKTNTEICRMQGLTKGEAQWISQTLRQSMRAWFR
ncbi:MAG: hypothetical protein FWD53_13570 [Phycisphaerales bacterium]|nr:hypothetical protein [Phycisphaerales bacterium]